LPETSVNKSAFPLSGNLDTGTLLDILIAKPKNLKLLIGHSKGNLLIDYVLEKFITEFGDNHPYYNELNIVTLGAITDIPDRFKRCNQFIGSIDWFGGLNSRIGLPHEKIPNAWHHLNTSIPFHLSVTNVLDKILL
jgi:hypothetical protein